MLGLYLHIPYCRALCHYCDFAKTANVTPEISSTYFHRLDEHLAAWLEHAHEPFSSVFVGGGTPSLYGEEYEPLFRRIRPRLAQGAEVTLEANPDDLTAERLAIWRRLGFNRLSLGVQTFEPAGLAFLKRTHGAAAAAAAARLALQAFPKVNLDLIYGWPGQDEAAWERDLAQAVALGAGHLSLYTLTYEPRTPIGRAAARGRLTAMDDDRVAGFFERACGHLGAAGFAHDEVSNWSRPGQSCDHNWLYWTGEPYIGIGTGAHGYLTDPVGPGTRYAYDRSDRAFLRRAPDPRPALADRFGVVVEAGRTQEHWVTEIVGASLRTTRGVPLAEAVRRLEHEFRPTPVIQEALAEGLMRLENGFLKLASHEWFREAAWAVEVLHSMN